MSVCKPRKRDKGAFTLLAQRKHPDGSWEQHRVASGETDLRRAEREAASYEVEINAGRVEAPANDDGGLIAFMDARIEDLEREVDRGLKSQGSLDAFRNTRKRLLEVVGEIPVDRLDRPALLRARDLLRDAGLGPDTIKTHMRRAMACWHWCEERGLVDKNWPRIKPLPKPAAKKRPFTPGEVEAVLEWAKSWEKGAWYPLLTLIADTGRRVSEVCRLKGATSIARSGSCASGRRGTARSCSPSRRRCWR